MKRINPNPQAFRKTRTFFRIKTGFVPALILGLLFTTTALGQGQTIRDDDPDPPYYANILFGPLSEEINDLVPIVFYRPPDQIPADFNLLEFFDFPRALTAEPLLVTGFYLAKEPAAPPLSQFLSGNAVPFWFFERPVIEAAAQDGILTIGELDSIVAFRGIASMYSEELHPDPGFDGVGGAVVPFFNALGLGTLEDGRSFRVHVWYTSPTAKGEVQIDIR